MEESKPPRPWNSRKRTKRNPRNRRGMPQPQQLKVTVRKIEDMERFGTVAQILDMIQNIVKKVNAENKNKAIFLPILLDESSIQALKEQERLATAREAEQAKTEESEHQMVVDVLEGTEAKGSVTTKVTKGEVNTEKSEPTAEFAMIVKEDDEQEELPKGPVVSARALYVVPPKKSQRRGIKSGCAYLVLNGPNVANNEDECVSMSQGDKSQATAKARLQLMMAVEALCKCAEEDSKANQQYGRCVIQQSMSGKAWKQHYWDNRDGTIETTTDYKHFMDKTEKEEEERISRPRPTPGGAVADPGSLENGEPVAAIVKHLQAKHQQEARRRKASTKKNAGNEAKIKKKGTAKDDVTKSNSRGGRPKQDKHMKRGKKKDEGSSKPPTQQAPSVMSTTDFPTL